MCTANGSVPCNPFVRIRDSKLDLSWAATAVLNVRIGLALDAPCQEAGARAAGHNLRVSDMLSPEMLPCLHGHLDTCEDELADPTVLCLVEQKGLARTVLGPPMDSQS